MRNALRFAPKDAHTRPFRPYLGDRLVVEVTFTMAPPQPVRWHDGVPTPRQQGKKEASDA